MKVTPKNWDISHEFLGVSDLAHPSQGSEAYNRNVSGVIRSGKYYPFVVVVRAGIKHDYLPEEICGYATLHPCPFGTEQELKDHYLYEHLVEAAKYNCMSLLWDLVTACEIDEEGEE